MIYLTIRQDTCGASLSRTMPVFSSAYAHALCNSRELHPCSDDDGYFHQVGIPGDLFLLLNEAVVLASQMSADIIADDIEERVQAWEPPPPPKNLSPKNALLADDFLHACRAWKASILIYIRRVFRDTKAADPELQTLVRECITNIASVVTKNILKQLVWSLFVAGSEIVVDDMRSFVTRIIEQIEKDIGCHFVADAGAQLKDIWQLRKDGEDCGREVGWKDVLHTLDGESYLFG
jgi:hypothetical protein